MHTTQGKFENRALILRLASTSTLHDPSRKRSFSKTLYKPDKFENADGVKILNHVISLTEMASNCCVLKFPRLHTEVTLERQENYVCQLQLKETVNSFLLTVNEMLILGYCRVLKHQSYPP